jgi:hypothetical protein
MSLRSTRRQAVWSLLALGALASPALAAPAGDDDDDENALPNTFISPCGQPFRAPLGAPYPVVDWFKAADKNADGKLDHAEFIADAAAFFTVLDVNNDGVLNRHEVAIYEQRIAPEIIGGRVRTSWNDAQLWLAQLDRPGPIDPGGDQPPDESDQKAPPLDESLQGAAPYGLLGEPEPVQAADLDLNGVITRQNFLKLADMHFQTLDTTGRGYLTLATLPKTEVQKLLEKMRPKKRRS